MMCVFKQIVKTREKFQDICTNFRT